MSSLQNTERKGLLVGMAIADRFRTDYKTVMEGYEPNMQLVITAHLEQMLNIYREDPENGYEKIYEAEMAFLEKHGSTMKSYSDVQFHKYFQPAILLAEKEIFSVDKWKILYSRKKNISPEDMTEFVNIAFNDVSLSGKFMFIGRSLNDLYEEKERCRKEMPRQLLAIYFLLTSQGIEKPAEDRAMAELIHLLTNIPFTSIEDSAMYEKYQQMPHYKKDKELLADLQYIRPIFEAVNLKGILGLIDEEVGRLQ